MWKFVSDQLENAELLATTGSTRPRQAALRRAVSTGYYALFQALCELAASQLVGWNKPWEAFTPIYRSLDHGHARTVLTETRGKKHALGEAVEKIGIAFRELQDAREWADYNPEPHPDPEKALAEVRFSRQDALELIQIARQAVQSLDALDDHAKLRLATLLVTRRRKETRR